MNKNHLTTNTPLSVMLFLCSTSIEQNQSETEIQLTSLITKIKLRTDNLSNEMV